MEPYRQKVLQEKIGLWSIIAVTSISAVIVVILLIFGDFQFIIKRHVVAYYLRAGLMTQCQLILAIDF